MDVEKDSLDVAAVLTDTLDGTGGELPLVDLFILLRSRVPDADRLKQSAFVITLTLHCGHMQTSCIVFKSSYLSSLQTGNLFGFLSLFRQWSQMFKNNLQCIDDVISKPLVTVY